MLHLEHRLLRVPDHPEGDGVDVHRNGVGGERGLGGEVADPDPLIDELGHLVDHRDDEEQTGGLEAAEAPEAEHDGPFPLIGDLQA